MPRTTKRGPVHQAWFEFLTGVAITAALVLFVKYWLVPLTEFIYHIIVW